VAVQIRVIQQYIRIAGTGGVRPTTNAIAHWRMRSGALYAVSRRGEADFDTIWYLCSRIGIQVASRIVEIGQPSFRPKEA
jgi:hypothetical protein